MSTLKWLGLYGMTVPVFLAIDMVWLGLVASGLYKRGLGPLMRPSPDWFVAVLFYLLYIIGILYFAVGPALEAGSLSTALFRGAAFGLFAYMTYDLTNLATLQGFPAWIAAMDMAWGTVLTGSVATVSYLLGRWIS